MSWKDDDWGNLTSSIARAPEILMWHPSLQPAEFDKKKIQLIEKESL